MDSIDKINKSVDEMESRLQSTIQAHFNEKSDKKVSFEVILEWFFTWRIKLEDLKNTYWCDGVYDLSVAQDGLYGLIFEGMAYVGPESDVEEIYESSFTGRVELDKRTKTIKSYDFKLNVNQRVFNLINRAENNQ